MPDKYVFLVSGKLQSGKNTFAEMLGDYFKDAGNSVSYDLFAKDLKDGCVSDFSRLHAVINKKVANIKTLMNIYFDAKEYGVFLEPIDDMLDELIFTSDNFYEDKTDITRALLQIYGTEIFRNRVDSDYWMSKLASRINESDDDVIIVTDVRYPNEILSIYDKVPNRTIIPIRIHKTMNREDIKNSHESELALDDYSEFEYIIDNNGSISELNDYAVWVGSDVTTKKEIVYLNIPLTSPLL